jgi:hypothetical protein
LSRALDSPAIEAFRLRFPSEATLLDSARGEYPAAVASDIVPMIGDLPPEFTDVERRFTVPAPFIARTALDWMTSATFRVIWGWGLLTVFAAAFLGEGPTYRLLGVAIAQANGAPASRLRKIGRSFVIVGPVFVAFAVSLSVSQLATDRPGGRVLTLAVIAIMAAAALYAIRHPYEGLSERLSGTLLVRR